MNIILDLGKTKWMSQGLCRRANPAIFEESDYVDTARAYCARCPVYDECLTYALADSSLDGVWGGTTHDERKALRRGGRRASCPGCRGKSIYSDGLTEICVSCGISWLS